MLTASVHWKIQRWGETTVSQGET